MSPYLITGIALGGSVLEILLGVIIGSCIRSGTRAVARPPAERPKR